MELLKAMKEMMTEMGAKMDTNMKTGQEKMDTNQARMEESLKGVMRLTASAIEDKMEAIVHSI
jgi:hypothetical protein